MSYREMKLNVYEPLTSQNGGYGSPTARAKVMRDLEHLGKSGVASILGELADNHPDWKLDSVFRRRQLSARTGRSYNHIELDESDWHSLVANARLPSHRPDAAASSQADATNLTVLQFSAATYFCTEGMDTATIEVLRIGDATGTCQVSFATKEGTATEGIQFMPVSGTLTFEPSEFVKSIEVPLLDNELFDTTTEFFLELSAETVVGATLGIHLQTCRVKFIDNDTFPSNSFPKDDAGAIVNYGVVNLMVDFIKLMWCDPLIKARTIKCALCDQVHNLAYVLESFLTIYLLDYVLNTDMPVEEFVLVKSRSASLISIVCIQMGLFAGLYFLDLWRTTTGQTSGPVRAKLQGGLMTKYMNFNAKSLATVSESDLVLVMSDDAYSLAQHGYTGAVTLGKMLGKVAVSLAIQIGAPIVFKRPFRPIAICASFILPFLLVIFARMRNAITSDVIFAEWARQSALLDHLHYCVDNYQLVVEYHNREKSCQQLDGAVKKYNAAHRARNVVYLNNKYFAPWLILLAASCYTFFGGLRVIEEDELVGMYVTNLKVLVTLGEAWEEIYAMLMDMQRVGPALERITLYMNRQTNLEARQNRSIHHRQSTFKVSDTLRQVGASGSAQDAFDILPIQFISRGYRFGDIENSSMAWGEVVFDQGTLNVLVGPHGGGKTTLLKILGEAVLPEWDDKSVSTVVPSHLRVLHVTNRHLFIAGGLCDNLTYGCHPATRDGDPKRMIDVCQKLGCSTEFVQIIKDEQETIAANGECDITWSTRLSQAELNLVSIARALIANYEVLLVHRPVMALNKTHAQMVMKTFREFVDQKGVCLDRDQLNLRRPRTCIATTSSRMEVVEVADAVFYIGRDKIERLSEAADI